MQPLVLLFMQDGSEAFDIGRPLLPSISSPHKGIWWVMSKWISSTAAKSSTTTQQGICYVGNKAWQSQTEAFTVSVKSHVKEFRRALNSQVGGRSPLRSSTPASDPADSVEVRVTVGSDMESSYEAILPENILEVYCQDTNQNRNSSYHHGAFD